MPAAMDNRRREEAEAMVASGKATDLPDARNRTRVAAQVDAERARMAKNPLPQDQSRGFANPLEQKGGVGTQFGNTPDSAPETEAEIKNSKSITIQ